MMRLERMGITVTELRQIHDFAIKWADKFRDPSINPIAIGNHTMANDCARLGFKWEDAHVFSEKYGQASNDYKILDQIIDAITDIALLGSAIYAQCRYFSHQAYIREETLAQENRWWFILALSRLAVLSGENPFVFQGTLKELAILSDEIPRQPMVGVDEEEKQHLIIDHEGWVWFLGYSFRKSNFYETTRKKKFKIKKLDVERLFDAFTAYFSKPYDEVFALETGNWILELTNTEGKTYRFRGALCANFEYKGIDLSDLVRHTVWIDGLYVFDGHIELDAITRLTLDYQRMRTIEQKNGVEGYKSDALVWEYNEHLMIDRATATLEHIQKNIGTGYNIFHRYELADSIESLLEEIDVQDLFTNIEGDPSDVIDTSNEIQKYKITIDYEKKPQRIIEGSYDKNGLPDDFSAFIETVDSFVHLYDRGEIFDPFVYGQAKRRQSDYIFCSVIFDRGYKHYYYLTDDEGIAVGDFVIVPAGRDNHEAVVEVVAIEYFSKENAPLPVEKTKKILRKYIYEGDD